MQRSKFLPVYLPRELYTRLEAQARAEERDAVQQATWILKQKLAEHDARTHANARDTTPGVANAG
jgi:hypothetical protein